MSAFGSRKPTLRQLDVTTVDIITDEGDKIPVHVLVVPTIATPLQNKHHRDISNLPHLKGLKLAHPVSDGNFEINLLIVADHYWDIVQDNIIHGEGGPTAMQSRLGYLLSGPQKSIRSQGNLTNIFHVMAQHGEDEFNLERFWSIESLGISPHDDGPENDFLSSYQATSISRDTDGAYNAKFPWKDEHPPLPTNFSVCEKRTRATARRLSQTPDLLKCYGEIIKEQEARGFIEKVQHPDPSDKAHYIPHHPVKKESSTTPIRIVYDCSCRQTPNSTSLNDCLMVGPPFLSDMGSMLVRFRSHAIGISTDIEKAFFHVRLDENDRNMTRFLWLSDPDDPESQFVVYRFKSILFRSASSPFMLNAVLHTHLDGYDTKVTQDMKDNLYVDNIITGCDTEDDTIRYYGESRSVMAKAKFNLRSWASNSKLLQAQATEDKVVDANSGNVSVLGLRWNTSADTLTLAPRETPPPHDILVTKREVLRESSKIFDLLGLITPVTISAKILMQDIWQKNVDWDEPLDEEIRERWIKIAQDIQQCTKVVIPRSYFTYPPTDEVIQLHVFVDASPKAYGAAAYLRQADQTSFVMAKARGAPLKKLTLPKLELMAALVGANLANFIINSLKKKFPSLDVILWSDSQIVLHWLHSSKQLQQFVANRVQEIKRLFPVTAWRYCPTADNPADKLTRGINAAQLQSSDVWQHGPNWLTTDEWPMWDSSTILLAEVPDSDTLAEPEPEHPEPTPTSEEDPSISNVIDISRYSTYGKLMRITAYVLR